MERKEDAVKWRGLFIFFSFSFWGATKASLHKRGIVWNRVVCPVLSWPSENNLLCRLLLYGGSNGGQEVDAN